MNKHLILPNDSTVLLSFNKDAQWVVSANGNVLQLTPVADTGVPAGGYIKPGHQTQTVGRHIILDITEVGTCDTLITQLTRVRNHLEKNGQEAKKAHIEALARQLAEAQHEYRMAYGVPNQGPNHAHNFDQVAGAYAEAPARDGAVNGGYPEDMVKLARELNQALEQSK